MNTADMQIIVKTLRRFSPPENIAKMVREHASVASHCPRCRTVWPCTLWIAGQAAQRKAPAE